MAIGPELAAPAEEKTGYRMSRSRRTAGSIPRTLEYLTALTVLNLENNQLIGEIRCLVYPTQPVNACYLFVLMLSVHPYRRSFVSVGSPSLYTAILPCRYSHSSGAWALRPLPLILVPLHEVSLITRYQATSFLHLSIPFHSGISWTFRIDPTPR